MIAKHGALLCRSWGRGSVRRRRKSCFGRRALRPLQDAFFMHLFHDLSAQHLPP
ncbi:hypothetical protein MYA_4801 [Burkholderia sp. KJ006]|nr:hypothetical protein MYA_4801 [Burkholderia sp. KJ006]